MVAVLGLGALAAAFWPAEAMRERAEDRALDASLMGVGGLATWLPAQGIALRQSKPRLRPKAAALSLRILPLYDVDLYAFGSVPKTAAEQALQSSQRDLGHYVFFAKLTNLPTLVVLPKWRTGFATTGVAYPALRIPDQELARLLDQTGLQGLRLNHGPAEFLTAVLAAAPLAEPRKVALYHAQLFNRASLPGHCAEIIGLPAGALLIRCEDLDDIRAAHYLADPDTLNNHGLSLAENAAFAVDLIAGLRPAGDARPVYLDTGTRLLLDLGETEAESYTREPEDLARFFAYPLSVLWAVAAIILGVTLWRGALRFGPALTPGEDRMEASKTAAIDAKARLLRLSGNDGRMAREFVQARLAGLDAQIFGRGYGQTGTGDSGVSRLFTHLAARNPALAADFRAVTTVLTEKDSRLDPADLHRHLETFRDLLERITDGPEPVSKRH